MSKAWNHANGGGRPWRRRRDACLAANQATTGGRCVAGIEKAGCTGRAEQAHHIYGASMGMGGPLAAVCAKCNNHIGDPMVHPASCCAWGFSKPQPIQVSRW